MSFFGQKKPLKTIAPLETSKSVQALMKTSMGDIRIQLFIDKAPNTVTNFIQLAEGTTTWRNPVTNQDDKGPLYNGLIFHRVIPGFMIQGGCPKGEGTGNPGYQFADEFHPAARHSKAGVLSMANSGPNTNGCQFFITCGPTPHLDDKHSVFGEVVAGLDVVQAIANAPRDGRDKPRQTIALHSIEIIRG